MARDLVCDNQWGSDSGQFVLAAPNGKVWLPPDFNYCCIMYMPLLFCDWIGTDLTAILVFSLLIGMINPGVDISHFNILLQVCSPQRRALAMGLFVTVMNAGLLLSSLAVAPLIELLGARTVVLVLGVLRLLGAALLLCKPYS
jgi:predicted MFS family arabinose efflux permease